MNSFKVSSKKDLEEGLANLEANIQIDIKTLGEIVIGEIQSLKAILPDKHYLDEKIGELRAEVVIKDKRSVKAIKHLSQVARRNHNIKQADKKDIAMVKDLINSAS